MGEELEKAEGSKNYYFDKISKLEYGEVVTLDTDVTMKELFSSEAWMNAKIGNFISSNKISFTFSEFPCEY